MTIYHTADKMNKLELYPSMWMDFNKLYFKTFLKKDTQNMATFT